MGGKAERRAKSRAWAKGRGGEFANEEKAPRTSTPARTRAALWTFLGDPGIETFGTWRPRGLAAPGSARKPLRRRRGAIKAPRFAFSTLNRAETRRDAFPYSSANSALLLAAMKKAAKSGLTAPTRGTKTLSPTPSPRRNAAPAKRKRTPNWIRSPMRNKITIRGRGLLGKPIHAGRRARFFNEP